MGLISFVSAAAFCVVAGGFLGHVGRSEDDSDASSGGCAGGGAAPSCQSSQEQRRCDCLPSCRYFGSCCANASFPRYSGGAAKRLPRETYQCEPERYGGVPTYVVSTCPQNSTVPRQLAALCDAILQENNYLDARFWPVSSKKSQLVYQSVYCALCHGEGMKNLSRWTASLGCPNGTDTRDKAQLLRLCKVHFGAPADFATPRCWKDFVDVCELSTANATIRSATAALGAAAPAAEADAAAAAAAAEACYGDPQAIVWRATRPFRNMGCAKCSGIPPSELVCSEVKSDRVQPIDVSLRLLLDPGGPSLPSDGCSSAAAQHCGGFEYYDHALCKCQPLCPMDLLQLPDGGCVETVTTPPPPQPTPSNATSRDSNDASTTPPAPKWRPIDANDCWWASYDVATAVLNASDAAAELSAVISHAPPNEAGGGGGVHDDVLYVTPSGATRSAMALPATAAVCAHCRWVTLPATDGVVGNLTAGVHWRRAGRWFRRPLVRLSRAATIVCLDPEEAAAFLRATIGGAGDEGCGQALDAVGVVLMTASIACLAVHAVAFFFISSLRNMPGKVVFSQVVALMLSYALYLSRVAAAGHLAACYATAVAVHYFLLAYFVWTLVLAVEIHGAVRALKRVYSGARRFVAYALVGWLAPLAVVVAAVLTDRYGAEPYRPGYGGDQCWMSNAHGYRIFFTAPMCAVVLADVVLYSAIVVRVVVISRRTARARDTQREKAVLSAKLLFALGVLWLFAVAGTASGSVVVICLFSNVLNTSQGVVIFAIFFCANKRVLEMARCCASLDELRSRISRGTSSIASSLGGTKRSRPSRPDDLAPPSREAPSSGGGGTAETVGSDAPPECAATVVGGDRQASSPVTQKLPEA